MRKIIVILLVLISLVNLAESQTINSKISRLSQSAFLRFDYSIVDMPADILNMGLLGGHLDIKLNNYFYSGVGIYGSLIGEKGGLFTLGADLGMNHNIYKNLKYDFGIHLAGGGGGNSPVGGGMMIMPYAGIKYSFKNVYLGLRYSYLDFVSGDIRSQQFNLHVDVPFEIIYASYSKVNSKINVPEKLQYLDDWNNVSRKRSFSIKFDNYFTQKGSKSTGNKDLTSNLNLVGFEYNHYFNENLYLIAEANGAYHGIIGGYMDIFGGLGYNLLPFSSFSLQPKLTFGAGGGGAINTAGGFLINPKIVVEQRFLKSFALNLSCGYLFSPLNGFNAFTLGFSVKNILNVGGLKNEYNEELHNTAKVKAWMMNFSNQTYFGVAKLKDVDSNNSLLSLQINNVQTPYFYISGQATFAYLGNCGAYAEGLIGGGINTNKTNENHIQYFAQCLVGTGGGGGVDTKQGFILKPSIGANLFLNDKYSLQIKAGQIFAPLARLNSTFFGLGFNYSFSILSFSDR
jgi:hypothetical protein